LRENNPVNVTPPELRYAPNPNAYRFRRPVTDNLPHLDLDSPSAEVKSDE
jgi:hypothetical protein